MTTAILLDLVILGVLVTTLALGWSRGLFRSLGELVVLALALVLAHQAAAYATPQLVDRVLRPATHTAIEEQVDLLLQENTPSISQHEEMVKILEAIPSDYIREKAQALLEGLELSLEEKLAYTARDTLVENGEKVADRVLDTAVSGICFTALYLLSFLVLNFLLRCILRALDLTMRLPVLRQVNQLGGLLFGAVKGVAIVCLGVWVLTGLGILITREVADSSLVLGRLLDWMQLTPAPTV